MDSVALHLRPEFRSFTLAEHDLVEMVAKKYSGSDFHDFLSDLVEKLAELRAVTYSITWVVGLIREPVWAESRLQMLLLLFLEYAHDGWHRCGGTRLRASSATSHKIKLEVDDLSGNPTVYKGFADIQVVRDSSEDPPLATFELKVPFGKGSPRLYKSEALSP
jgi:hypothetical protein